MPEARHIDDLTVLENLLEENDLFLGALEASLNDTEAHAGVNILEQIIALTQQLQALIRINLGQEGREVPDRGPGELAVLERPPREDLVMKEPPGKLEPEPPERPPREPLSES
jgi:hypothetical protein